jgi:hypothetical protein
MNDKQAELLSKLTSATVAAYDAEIDTAVSIEEARRLLGEAWDASEQARINGVSLDDINQTNAAAFWQFLSKHGLKRETYFDMLQNSRSREIRGASL